MQLEYPLKETCHVCDDIGVGASIVPERPDAVETLVSAGERETYLAIHDAPAGCSYSSHEPRLACESPACTRVSGVPGLSNEWYGPSYAVS